MSDSRFFAARPLLGLLLTCSVIALGTAPLATAAAETKATGKVGSAPSPTLIISNQPLPADLAAQVYSHPARAPEVTPQKIIENLTSAPAQTVVARKIEELRSDLFNLQRNVTDLSERTVDLQAQTQTDSAAYYAAVATISTQLQSGTTPGNPRLVQRLANAQDALETLADRVGSLNDLAMEVANQSSFASYLLESSRAAYGLTGAVEEDHSRLAQLEDAVNNTAVIIERLQNNVNDDITRTSAYLATERGNLRTLALAIENGDLYGKSLSARPFSSVPLFGAPTSSPTAAAGMTTTTGLPETTAQVEPPQGATPGPRALARIKFDRPDVKYEEPIYLAVHEALERYPNASFDLVAVHPDQGNPAKIAIESSRARRNAEKVLRTLTQMGLPVERINLSYAPSSEATSNEVHLYVR